MFPYPSITAQPSVMQGQACIRGTRVTVANLLRQLAAGRTIPQLCADYPQVNAASIQEALAFAAELSSEESHDLIAS
jgi:uncharacterized protein (DUF433 family)